MDNAEGVLNWIKRSHDAGLRTTANVTVTRLNYSELFKTMSLALIAGADTVLINRFLPGGRGLQYRKELELSRQTRYFWLRFLCVQASCRFILSIGVKGFCQSYTDS